MRRSVGRDTTSSSLPQHPPRRKGSGSPGRGTLPDNQLVILSNAKKAVAVAHSVIQAHKLVKLAEAVLAVTDSEEMREQATELYLRARRRRGELERKLPKQDGGDARRKTTRSKNETELIPLTLKEQGIDKREASKDYRLLEIPERRWEEFIAQPDKNLTRALRIAKDVEREKKRVENAELVKAAPPLPETKASTIVIDPPWDKKDEGDIDQLGRGQPTYKMMSLEELLRFPVGERAETNAHIYLWITNRSLPKGFALLDAWGFRYVTCLTWCKPSFGIGNYFRGQTEHILFGVRGSLSLLRSDVGTCFSWPRPKGHSAKPEEFYSLIESCSPGPWMDLFARRQRPGWICWGAEL